MKHPGKNQKTQRLTDAIFLVTGERSCPLYDVGEEIKVENSALSVATYKPGCLILAQDVIRLVSSRETIRHLGRRGSRLSPIQSQKKRFSCGGCGGEIRFEYKQEKDYATLQMKMLRDAEARWRKRHLERFFGMMRKLELFKSLEDDALTDLTLLLELKSFLPDKIIARKGDPGINLYIVLSGRTALVGEDHSRIEELGPGEICGALQLLSGVPVEHDLHSLEPCQIGILSVKNFRTILRRFPVLQIFLFKLLVERVQAATLRSGNISSGMTGNLEEISAVDLFQLINSAQKTGRVDLVLGQSRGTVYFVDGEIHYAHYEKSRGKDALFEILGKRKGRFSYTRGVPEKVAQLPPLGGFMGLMMEGVQQLDEGSETAPSR